MIENAQLESLLANSIDWSVVCEFYDADATPGSSGFEPTNAVHLFAAVEGITFEGEAYACRVKRFGSVDRTITKKTNSASVELLNFPDTDGTRFVSNYELTTGFEGMIMVIRLISRADSTKSNSLILFTGRCEKPSGGSKESLTVKANFILDSLDVKIPRRKFSPTDYKGRDETDPEFEGFPEMPQYGTIIYSERQKRGGLLGLFGFKKTVIKTLQYSSHSDLDANRPLPEVFGGAQIEATHLGYIDVGTQIRIRSAFCEGEIEDMINVRSVDPAFPLNATSYAELYGLVGALNGPDDPSWIAPGNYSRTAYIRAQADNSAVADDDPAPTVVGYIKGRKLKTPDATGDWNADPIAWTNNAAAVVRYLLTGGDYYELDENWIDDAAAAECFEYNAEQIFDLSGSDFYFLEAG